MNEERTTLRPAGHTLAQSLIATGATHAWCVPGESYLGLMDGLRDAPGFRLVTCRHEGGAGFMALAEARLTGKPGLLMVSRGPGAGNATIAAHVAQQDGVPLILIIGQVPRDMRNRSAFQEVDYARTFQDMAKAVIEVNEPSRIAEFAAQAWHTAQAGRPGLVVLSLPEDVLLAEIAAPPQSAQNPRRPGPSAEDLDAVHKLLSQAKRPLLLAGEALSSQAGRSALLELADAWNLPVLCGHKHQDLFPNRHPGWAGHIGHVVPKAQAGLWAQADLILAAGTLLGEIDTQGYRFPSFPRAQQRLVQIHHDPLALARHYQPDLAVCADPAALLSQLARLSPAPAQEGWRTHLHDLAAPPTPQTAYQRVLAEIDRKAPQDAIFTMDSGTFASSTHRFLGVGGARLMVGTASGAMGNGAPAAVAAAILHAGRTVIAIVGDGGLLMTGNELATAQLEAAPIRILVPNNASYGAIAGHQDRIFPGRRHATDLVNPDFAKWAESFGALGLRIGPQTDIAEAVDRFLTHPGHVLLEVAS